ncbi:uncharacterized protein LOC134824551 isoform X2 [Bolinopsis microptera]|uniref:uncharacterized protein LOC134824551 isoform X2 n=1 Tax=Bolinopsis microptera TaxID=2820187 RepID=UPI00307AEE5A
MESCPHKCSGCVTDKGHIALTFSILVVCAGSVSMFAVSSDNKHSQSAGKYLLSIGLFAFSGGFTNWIAIQMLFYKIPLIYGSGVLRRRYKAIRCAMKDMILGTFFQPEFLNKYIPQKLREAAAEADVENKINLFLNTETGQKIIEDKIDQISASPEGQLVESMDINVGTFKPLIKPVIVSFLSDLGPSVLNHLIEPDNGALNLDKLRDELNRYMCERMLEVTPQMIQDIMYTVVLQYLGWLIVWGCVFGGVMGVICQAIKLTPDYENWAN